MLDFFKGRLRVSPFALVLLLIVCLSPDAVFFALALFFALLHELGHIVAMRLFKTEILCLSVYPFGLDIRAASEGLSYKREAVVALAGPLVSLVLSLFACTLFLVFPNVYLLSAVISNGLFFLVNILPVKGLDGGRMLLALLLSRLDYSRALRIFNTVSTFAFALLSAAALFLLFESGYNLSLVFVCTYLFISEYVKTKFCP